MSGAAKGEAAGRYTAVQMLEGITAALARRPDPESVLQDTLARCLDGAGSSTGAILFFGPDGPSVKSCAGRSSRGEWAADLPVLERAMAQGRWVVPSYEGGPDEHGLLTNPGTPAALLVPILVRDEAIGMLVVAIDAQEARTTEAESLTRAVRSVSLQLGHALTSGAALSRLGASEQRYRALFDHTRDAIAVLTPEGVILEANRRWQAIIPRSQAGAIGLPARWLTAVDGGEGGTAPSGVAAGGGSPLVDPTPIRQVDGTTVHVEFSRTPVEVGGERLVFVIGRDVSDRLRREEELRQAQKMEAIGRLAGGVAHDMNNVLAAVLSYAELLNDGLAAEDPRRDDAEEIRSAALRGAALTRQLLAFSRQQLLEPRVVSLNDIVVRVVETLRTLVSAAIQIDTRLDPRVPPVSVDPGHMEQVIMNLASNSHAAMPSGGRLVIATALESGRVVLSIADTGAGMDAATLEHVFEPFFTTKGRGKGSGIGLSTVFGIVKQSGGDIHVESELARGTTFRIELPAASPKQRGARGTARPRRVQASEAILLVEDDDALRPALARSLRDRGYSVDDATNASEALAAFEAKAGRFDLLVTDVVLVAGPSGAELSRQIREKNPATKVLFISAYTDRATYREVFATTPPFLQKPFTLDVFAAKVRAVLDVLP